MQTEKEVEDALAMYMEVHNDIALHSEEIPNLIRMTVIAVLYWMLEKPLQYPDDTAEESVEGNPVYKDLRDFREYLEKKRENRGPNPGTPGPIQEG
jgi:hypothetical protein